jgi:hypothetical protein
MHVRCVSPTKEILANESAQPMNSGAVQKALTEVSPARGGIPTTVVLVSTSGFTLEAHELAERRHDRTVILVEPNDAGGWSVWGPAETKALTDLFDPEADEAKRQRIRQHVDENKVELLTSGLATDRIASKLQLPLRFVEEELKSYAKQNAGLAAKRLDGRVVLFREGSTPSAATSAAATTGGSAMPMIDKIRSLFSRKGENEKKIAFLSERRALLSQQRDRAYEDMNALETKEAELRQQFKDATGALVKRRITSQLLQMRKDLERRQQLIGVLNQQVNVVSTHLHNLELVQQGQSAKLPDSEELASDAAAAEEMLAQLQADNELAESVGTVAHAGMTAEEQALYEELERESGGPTPTKIKLDNVEEQEEQPLADGGTQKASSDREASSAPKRRTEPEAG